MTLWRNNRLEKAGKFWKPLKLIFLRWIKFPGNWVGYIDSQFSRRLLQVLTNLLSSLDCPGILIVDDLSRTYYINSQHFAVNSKDTMITQRNIITLWATTNNHSSDWLGWLGHARCLVHRLGPPLPNTKYCLCTAFFSSGTCWSYKRK